MTQTKKIFIAGHNGMVGSAIKRRLNSKKNIKILTSSKENLNLLNQASVEEYFREHRPDQVYIAAAKVGGIFANNEYPAEFIYQNIMIQTNIIHSAYITGISSLLFLGSSCIYPKNSTQPITEKNLLNGYLEPTNEPYGIAKISGIKMCESYNRQYGVDYRSVMPTNLYGIGDNYHPTNSHVIPSLIRRFHEAKLNNTDVVVWGSGDQSREFLYVDDLADACIFVMEINKEDYQNKISDMTSHINIGIGQDITIRELANTIAKVIGFSGDISYDTSKPDGTKRKLLDTSLINSYGWKAKISLEEGLKFAYHDFIKNNSL